MDDSDHRDKRAEFAHQLLEARPIVYRTVYKWMRDKWETDEIVGETEYRSWAYMEKREWKPKIRNMVAFELEIAVNLRNDTWSKRQKEGCQSLDSDTDEQTEKYLGDGCRPGETEVEKEIYNRELFDEVAWQFILSGLTLYEIKIFVMHAIDKMKPKEIAYELQRDVHLLRYELQNVEEKIRSRGKQFLEHTDRTAIYKREA